MAESRREDLTAPADLGRLYAAAKWWHRLREEAPCQCRKGHPPVMRGDALEAERSGNGFQGTGLRR